MKVRIGVGTQRASGSGEELADFAVALEELGFDSVWLPDVLSVPVDDPIAGLSFLAGRCPRLKLGTTLVLPGCNPVRLAHQIATADRLSGGRLLVTLVAGIRRRRELEAIGVAAEDRGAQMDEMLPLLRRLWSEDEVDHSGSHWTLRGARVEPKPAPGLDRLLWLGGTAPEALRRAGRFAEGWLPSLCTPAEAEAGRQTLEAHAADAGRVVDPEHFGVCIGYLRTPAAPELTARLASRRGNAPPAEVTDLVPDSLDGLRSLLERFMDAGFSKFVVRPIVPPADWLGELEALADAVLDLQR